MTYLAKGSRPGHDVKTAIDYLNTFNSSFPLLNLDSSALHSSTFSHDLGYFPFFFTTYNASGFVPGGVNQVSGDEWSISTSQLVRSSGSGNIRCFISRLDLTNNFSAPHVPGDTAQGAINPDYEFKIAKEGKSFQSTDMRDFSIHSNTISPLVHRVYSATMFASGGDYYATVAHGLPYTPLAFAFIRPSTNSIGRATNRYYMLPPPVGTTSQYYAVDQAISGVGGSGIVTAFADGHFAYSAAPQISIVILKDPFLKNVVNVSYP
jgi:hypothetical protein